MEFGLLVTIVVGGLIVWAVIQAFNGAAVQRQREAQMAAHLRMLRAQVNDQMHRYLDANASAKLDDAAAFGARWLTMYYGLEPQRATWLARSAIREECGFDPFEP